jgi:multidrug transporter EmrE-like cation transporter
MQTRQWLLVLTSVALAALAQLCLKLGTTLSGSHPSDLLASYARTLTSGWTWAGLSAYLVSVLVWLRVLAELDLSLAYPFVALGVALTSVLGIVVLGEPAVVTRLAGTALIVGGVVLMGYR